jgi:glycosyltransferase involved in cell wall biosynthesis
LPMSIQHIVLSVCIPTYNRSEFIGPLLNSLKELSTLGIPYEIIVCDNDSTDDTENVIGQWLSEYENIVYFKQKKNVGAPNNIISAYRLARGEFCVYLADDDRLDIRVLKSYLEYFEINKSTVALYAPWDIWDDSSSKSMCLSYVLDKEYVFSKNNPLELFNLIIMQNIIPEIFIVRTEVICKVATTPFESYWAFVFLTSLLSCGDIVFMPVPYYKYLIVNLAGPRLTLGYIEATKNQHHLRAGLEFMAQKILKLSYGDDIPASELRSASEMINVYVLNKMHNGALLLLEANNGRGSYEWLVRAQFLGWKDKASFDGFNNTYSIRAAAQHIVETFEGFTFLNKLAIYNSASPELLLDSVRRQGPNIETMIITEFEFDAFTDRSRVLVVAGVESDRLLLQAAGFSPGLILIESECLAQFQL